MKTLIRSIFCIGMLLFSTLYSAAPWNFTLAVQKNDDLVRFSTLDTGDIIQADSSSSPFIIAQFEMNQSEGAWRYRLTSTGLELTGFSTITIAEHPLNGLCDLITWSMRTFSGKQNALALWGDEGFIAQKDINQALKRTAQFLGKKLDLLACNGCYSTAFETAFEIAPYCSFLVASEQNTMNEGYAYAPSFKQMTVRGLKAKELAQTMVHSYEELYPAHEGPQNTQTALDLSLMPECIEDFDNFIQKAERLFKGKSNARILFREARIQSPSTDAPDYVDLISFLTLFQKKLDLGKVREKELSQAIEKLLSSLKKMVIAHTGYIQTVGDSNGIKIYLPLTGIHNEYLENYFAKKTRWVKLLRSTLGL